MNLFRLQYPIILAVFFLPSAYFAAKPISIDDSLTNKKIGLFVEYLEDKDKNLSIKELTRASGEPELLWKKSEKDQVGLGYTNSACWIRFRVTNQTDKDRKWLLELRNPHIDNIRFFIPDKSGGYKKVQTGDTFAFANRPVKYRTFVFPLNTAAKTSETYYLRAEMVGALRLPLAIWSPKAFQENKESEAIILWMYYGAIAVMILYNLFIFLVTRELSYLYYSLYVASVASLFMVENGYGLQYFWSNTLWWQSHGKVFIYSSTILWMTIFFREYLNTRKLIPRRDYVLIFYAAMSYVPFVMAVFFELLEAGLMLFNFMVGTGAVYLAYLSLYLAISKHKSRQARFFLLAFSTFLLGAVVLILNNFKVISNSFFTQYTVQIGSFFEITLLSFALSDRIRVMKDELQTLNLNLEQKVQERTIDLKTSNQELSLIKTKQDHDYYLTSLLLEPLGTIEFNRKFVMAETLIKQKKEYDFADARREIGGDYCLIDTINLQSREYTVLLNADAMGKSLQGSGGVLVLGSLIQAYLIRSKETDSMGEYPPEKWLKNALRELDSVFKSFDGSMLMSFFLALLDNGNGILYYTQGEHPETVLYRAGNSRFLQDKGKVWKLGSNVEKNQLVINTLELQRGDVLVIGSDGRDDLRVIGPDGEPEWRMDKEPFLKVVEEAAAELPVIKTLLEETGQLTDDLSLIRLEFLGAPENDENHAKLLARLHGDLNDSIQQKNWDKAANLADQILVLQPLNNQVMGDAVAIAQHLPDKEHGIELGKRLVLRAPEVPDTWRLLGILYAQIGEQDKADGLQKIYDELLLTYDSTDKLPPGF